MELSQAAQAGSTDEAKAGFRAIATRQQVLQGLADVVGNLPARLVVLGALRPKGTLCVGHTDLLRRRSQQRLTVSTRR